MRTASGGNRTWWGGRASNPVGGATRRREGSTPSPSRQAQSAEFLVLQSWAPLSDTCGANGVVVQLVRIPACHAGGRGFEPRPLRQQNQRVSTERANPFLVWYSKFWDMDTGVWHCGGRSLRLFDTTSNGGLRPSGGSEGFSKMLDERHGVRARSSGPQRGRAPARRVRRRATSRRLFTWMCPLCWIFTKLAMRLAHLLLMLSSESGSVNAYACTLKKSPECGPAV